ncbi:MAG TPA: MFS transporter, partial [Pirellulaceae bacterium]|nr:MFS transporter [Pirellulaceae bacterium]
MSKAATSASPSKEPAREYRYFPGWTMLGFAAAAQYMSAPGQSYSVAAFKEPMREGLAVSETQYSLAYGAATILSGLALPFVGRLVDRVGARVLLPAIALLLGGACVCMSRAEGILGLYVGFMLIRPLGQGALTLVGTWLVGEWFERRRGFATAISGIGGSVSVMTIPLLNRWVIAEYDWRTAWFVLGCLVWTTLVLPGWLFIRDRPEDLGLQPDGLDSLEHPSKSHPDAVSAWTVAQVLRDPTFWKLLSVPATSGMVGTGLIFHQVALLGSRGVSPTWALGLISFQAVVATLAVLGTGWLTDRYSNRHILGISMLMLALATLLVLVMPRPEMAIAYAALLGLHGSVMRSTGNVVWLNYYG